MSLKLEKMVTSFYFLALERQFPSLKTIFTVKDTLYCKCQVLQKRTSTPLLPGNWSNWGYQHICFHYITHSNSHTNFLRYVIKKLIWSCLQLSILEADHHQLNKYLSNLTKKLPISKIQNKICSELNSWEMANCTFLPVFRT